MKRYTAVGSREAPRSILRLMSDLSYQLAKDGWTACGGEAEGSDEAFINGVKRYWDEAGYQPHLLETYIPREGSRGVYSSDGPHVYCFDNLPHQILAERIAEYIHPAWDKCNEWARKLHRRNPYQVLGKDLASPTQALICWAKPDGKGSIRGGTRTSWELAKANNVPCINLYYEEAQQRAQAYLRGERQSRTINPWVIEEGLANVIRQYVKEYIPEGEPSPWFLDATRTLPSH